MQKILIFVLILLTGVSISLTFTVVKQKNQKLDLLNNNKLISDIAERVDKQSNGIIWLTSGERKYIIFRYLGKCDYLHGVTIAVDSKCYL